MPDRTADTLVTIIRDWIEPGTTIISDQWAAYHNLDSHGYTHRVNHSFQFVDPVTKAHTNTIESTWRTVKVFLGQYNGGRLNTIWHITCSRQGARSKGFHSSCKSFTSSPTRTGPCVMCRAPRDTPVGISCFRYGHACVVCYYLTSITSQPPAVIDATTDNAVNRGFIRDGRGLAAILGPGFNSPSLGYALEFWTNRESLTPLPNTLGAVVVGDV